MYEQTLNSLVEQYETKNGKYPKLEVRQILIGMEEHMNTGCFYNLLKNAKLNALDLNVVVWNFSQFLKGIETEGNMRGKKGSLIYKTCHPQFMLSPASSLETRIAQYNFYSSIWLQLIKRGDLSGQSIDMTGGTIITLQKHHEFLQTEYFKARANKQRSDIDQLLASLNLPS